MKALLFLTGRIGTILVAALLIVGITMSLVDTSGASQMPADRGTAVVQSQSTADSTASTETTQTAAQTSEGGMPSGEFHGPGNQSVVAQLAFGLLGVLQNTVIIGVIVLIVTWIERRFTAQPAKLVS